MNAVDTIAPTTPTWQWRGPNPDKAAARYRERFNADPPQPQERRDAQGVTWVYALPGQEQVQR